MATATTTNTMPPPPSSTPSVSKAGVVAVAVAASLARRRLLLNLDLEGTVADRVVGRAGGRTFRNVGHKTTPTEEIQRRKTEEQKKEVQEPAGTGGRNGRETSGAGVIM